MYIRFVASLLRASCPTCESNIRRPAGRLQCQSAGMPFHVRVRVRRDRMMFRLPLSIRPGEGRSVPRCSVSTRRIHAFPWCLVVGGREAKGGRRTQ